MPELLADYRLTIALINLVLAIFAGTIAMMFFRKNRKKIGGGAIYLMASFFFIVFFEFLEFYNAVMLEENFIIKSLLMFGILGLIIFGLWKEAKEITNMQSPYEIVFDGK